MRKYDVAVIGLGAMGSAALHHLARRGLSVIGFDRFGPGHEKGSSHGGSRAIRLGYFEHPSYVPLLRRAYENWHALEERGGETVLTITGVLEIGRPGSAIVAGSLEASRLHDLPHEHLDAAAIMRRHPAFTLPGDYEAVWQPDGGYLVPERANSLHLRLAEADGAAVAYGQAVAAVEPERDHVDIRLDGETVRAGRAVVTAGAWIGDLVPPLAPHLRLTRQVQCWFEPKEPEAVRRGSLPVFIIDGEADVAYGFPVIDGAGFKCASHRSSGEIADADNAAQDAGEADEGRMRAFLEAYLPAAAGPLAAMRTCIYTRTPDEDFVIDALPDAPHIVFASACSGHGFKFASVIGEVLADLATEGATRHDIDRFRLARLRRGA